MESYATLSVMGEEEQTCYVPYVKMTNQGGVVQNRYVLCKIVIMLLILQNEFQNNYSFWKIVIHFVKLSYNTSKLDEN